MQNLIAAAVHEVVSEPSHIVSEATSSGIGRDNLVNVSAEHHIIPLDQPVLLLL